MQKKNVSTKFTHDYSDIDASEDESIIKWTQDESSQAQLEYSDMDEPRNGKIERNSRSFTRKRMNKRHDPKLDLNLNSPEYRQRRHPESQAMTSLSSMNHPPPRSRSKVESHVEIEFDDNSIITMEDKSRSNSFEKMNRSKPMRDRDAPAHDYLQFAKLYRLHRKYHDPHCTELCVLCQHNVVSHVLFPCNHRCVCSDCILSYDICEYTILMAENFPNCHYNCPLCAGIIKKIFPMDNGSEIDRYWEWCYEVVPTLPTGFEKKFAMSAEVIRKVIIDDAHGEANDGSKACVLS